MSYPTRKYRIGPTRDEAETFEAESLFEAFRDARKHFEQQTKKKALQYYGLEEA